MKTLRLKRYFLEDRDREQYEQELLEKHPEWENIVLEWDDEELLEKVKISK